MLVLEEPLETFLVGLLTRRTADGLGEAEIIARLDGGVMERGD